MRAFLYYGVIGKPVKIAITDILKVGQLVKSRAMQDERGIEARPYGDGEIGLILEIEEKSEVHDRWRDCRHVVKILWQHRGTVEDMPDWFAEELLEPIPS